MFHFYIYIRYYKYKNIQFPDCRYLEEYDKVLELSEYKKEFAEFEDLAIELTKSTGKNITTTLNMANLYHSLMAVYSMNLPLPAWTKSIFPYGRLHNATLFAYKTSNYNKSLRKIYGGIQFNHNFISCIFIYMYII